MTLKRTFIISTISMVAFCLRAADAGPLLRALIPDSVASDRTAAVGCLDSLASSPSPYAETAAGVSLLLRGRHELGSHTLEVALQRSADRSPVFAAVADYLIEYWAETDSASAYYEAALEAKAQYLTRIDSLTPDIFITLADQKLKKGDLSGARRNLGIALTNCGTPDSLQLLRIAALYSATVLSKDRPCAPWWLWSAAALAVAAAAVAVRYGFRKRSAEDAIKSDDPTAPVAPAIGEAARAMLSLALFASEKNRDLCLLVERKLAAGQSKDLYATISAGKYFAKYRTGFLDEFDRSFLQAFPEFPATVNALLKPESRLDFGERLTPEERIAAFISLGITGSSELAETLGLSLNTVYTYRNRLKGRAVQRSDFEENLRDLSSGR